MTLRFSLTTIVAILLVVPRPAVAQSQAKANVVLAVPINLRNFGPDVSKVRVACSIRSEAITTAPNREVTGTDEAPMTEGGLVATLNVGFNFTGLDNPLGKTATISCTLAGWSVSQQDWLQFSGGPTTNPSFRPADGQSLGGLDASFIW